MTKPLKVAIEFPNETDLIQLPTETVGFHSVDGRPLYKDVNGVVRDPIETAKDQLFITDTDNGNKSYGYKILVENGFLKIVIEEVV